MFLNYYYYNYCFQKRSGVFGGDAAVFEKAGTGSEETAGDRKGMQQRSCRITFLR